MYSRISFIAPLLLTLPTVVLGEGPVAVVASLAGDASAILPKARTPAPVHALDWLQEGARLEVRPRAKMSLILLSGRTYRLEGGARATVGADALTAVNRQVREMNRLPPIPKFVPLADTAVDVSGATPIRGVSHIKNLYPQHVRAIASHVRLTFAPFPDVSNYSVTLEDEGGNTLFRVTTLATSVAVPSDVLGPGSRYSWSVRAVGATGILGEGTAEFTTMSKDDFDRRSAFARATSPDDRAMQLALLADVDQQLGLLAEARDEFEAALELRPSDPALQHAFAAAKAALAAAGDK